MKQFVSFLISFAVLCTAASGLTESDFWILRDRLGAESPEIAGAAKRALSEADRNAAIERMRREMLRPENASDVRGYWRALFILGDDTARRLFVKDFAEDHGSDMKLFVAAGDAALVPMLVPELEREEPFGIDGSGDVTWYPPSFMAARTIARLVANSPDFSPETINWARRYEDRYPDKSFRAMWRKWWKANERSFREGNYKAVKPGDGDLEPSPLQAAAPDRSESDASQPSSGEHAPHSNRHEDPAKDESPAGNVDSGPPAWALWTGALVSIGIGGALYARCVRSVYAAKRGRHA